MNEIDPNQKENFIGYVSKIQQSNIFYKVFENFPLGLFQVDDEDKIIRVNHKFVEMLDYQSKDGIQGKYFKELCEDKDKLESHLDKIRAEKFTRGLLRLKTAQDKIIEVECYSRLIDESGNARWGMIDDVTERERYYRSLDRLPTGFFYIEKGLIVQCNDQFAKIHGYKNKQDLTGVFTKILFADENDWKKYLEKLHKADEKGEALHNYEFRIRRVDNNKIITVSVDSHMVKDIKGNIIGREGTVRDVTEKKELEQRVEKAAAEIHRLLHTLFHPVVTFAGKSKTLFHTLDLLHQTIPPLAQLPSDSRELGRELRTQIVQINESLLGKKESYPLIKLTLLENLIPQINVLDHTLKTEKDKAILDTQILSITSWILEELIKMNYFREDTLKSFIKKDFVEFLQGILLHYLRLDAELLMAETEMMTRRVNSIRTYISLEKQRKYSFTRQDLKKILEDNTRLFGPLLAEKGIGIDPKIKGNLMAEISKQDIDRVLSNLFQNVINYSFKGQGRFVKMYAKECQPQDVVEISIENLGLPVTKEEIGSGDIFKYGTRGTFSYKGDRDGLGVGLADAKDVIEAHGGQISITSKPALDDGNPPRYQVPYRTTVTIITPKKQNAGKNKE